MNDALWEEDWLRSAAELPELRADLRRQVLAAAAAGVQRRSQSRRSAGSAGVLAGVLGCFAWTPPVSRLQQELADQSLGAAWAAEQVLATDSDPAAAERLRGTVLATASADDWALVEGALAQRAEQIRTVENTVRTANPEQLARNSASPPLAADSALNWPGHVRQALDEKGADCA